MITLRRERIFGLAIFIIVALFSHGRPTILAQKPQSNTTRPLAVHWKKRRGSTFLGPDDVESTLGKHTIRVEGLSVIVYDSPQFFSHYYHWWGEIILGAWRILALKERRRRKRSSQRGSATVLYASIEESDYWNDHIKLNATVVFDRVLLINRPAAHRHRGREMVQNDRGTMNITVPTDFWAPIRQTLVQNILGYVPEPEEHTQGSAVDAPKTTANRWSRLADLEAEGVCEFHEARMEAMSLREQIELPARSTIIGRRSCMNMDAPSHRSTIFEIFDPEGYIFDYEMLARNMGHRHYAVWNDSLHTYPKELPRRRQTRRELPRENYSGACSCCDQSIKGAAR
ncbi:putative protein of unknown function (DUF563) [Lyophyllum shimeji]|uniref:Uncharacterized protein n=1 Tax=Lyophyllum shimeji TaxID=47721 RepID=A0A9P3PMC2_LYOSH|nr:putative protein of unknown function (DUF563) [Lyophyllum shimeji]